jgi:hypothetical protein
MIASDKELEEMLERIARVQAQVAHLRQTETSPVNYHAAASGFLTEIDLWDGAEPQPSAARGLSHIEEELVIEVGLAREGGKLFEGTVEGGINPH